MMTYIQRTLKRVGKILMGIGIVISMLSFLNFFVYSEISVRLGGTPDYEKSWEGTYYLSQHGQATKVSERTFMYMEWYGIVTWGLMFLAVIEILFGLIYGSLRKNNPVSLKMNTTEHDAIMSDKIPEHHTTRDNG